MASGTTSPTDDYIQGPGLPGLCPGAYEAGMPHPSPQGCVHGVARRQAGQARAVAINLIGTLQYFGSTPLISDQVFAGGGYDWAAVLSFEDDRHRLQPQSLVANDDEMQVGTA